MMRISTQNGVNEITLKLEGRLVGACVPELERFWNTLAPSMGMKKLCLDIRGVAYLDGKGKQVLKDILTATGAEIRADSLLTKQFAGEIAQKICVSTED